MFSSEILPNEAKEVHLSLNYKTRDSFAADYKINISRGVFFITMEKPHPVGTPIKLRLNLPGITRSLELHGLVSWVCLPATIGKSTPGIGIEITGCLTSIRQTINEYLHSEIQPGNASFNG